MTIKEQGMAEHEETRKLSDGEIHLHFTNVTEKLTSIEKKIDSTEAKIDKICDCGCVMGKVNRQRLDDMEKTTAKTASIVSIVIGGLGLLLTLIINLVRK